MQCLRPILVGIAPRPGRGSEAFGFGVRGGVECGS